MTELGRIVSLLHNSYFFLKGTIKQHLYHGYLIMIINLNEFKFAGGSSCEEVIQPRLSISTSLFIKSSSRWQILSMDLKQKIHNLLFNLCRLNW